jgi:hypothetical protein
MGLGFFDKLRIATTGLSEEEKYLTAKFEELKIVYDSLSDEELFSISINESTETVPLFRANKLAAFFVLKKRGFTADDLNARKANKILGDEWIDELIAWAIVNDIPKKQFPHQKKELLAITEFVSYAYDDYNNNNRIYTRIPVSFCRLVNLTTLILNHQTITIPKSLGELVNLTHLSLSGNKFTKVPDFIENLTNLTELDLSENLLTIMPNFVGDLTNLTKLNFEGNQLTKLPEFVGNLVNLKELHLENNQLTKIPESIGNLVGLKELNLGSNRLTKIPEFIGKLPNLTTLAVFGNEIVEIPSSISSKVKIYQ